MTKKETAMVEDLLRELAIARALRFTEPVGRDLPPPERFNDISHISRGWDFVTHGQNFRVEKACSDSISHHFGGWEKVTTQKPRALFSTRLLALKACRYAAEMNCAALLAEIDAEISREQMMSPEVEIVVKARA